MLFPALFAYRNSAKTATGFTPFHLVHDEEVVLREDSLPLNINVVGFLLTQSHIINVVGLRFREEMECFCANRPALPSKWKVSIINQHY